jgi:Uma2 family endonuclease
LAFTKDWLVPTSSKKYLNAEEYLYRERTAEYRSEFFRGETFAMAEASDNHNLIVLNSGAMLREQLKKRPCRVYPSDLKLRIEATGLYAYPDLSIVCGEPKLETDTRDVLLNPVVLVEVLSDSTEAYDRGKKFQHYRTIPSLMHYVLLAQDRHAMECFSRQMDDTWRLTECNDLAGSLALSAIDCQLSATVVYDKVAFEVTA